MALAVLPYPLGGVLLLLLLPNSGLPTPFPLLGIGLLPVYGLSITPSDAYNDERISLPVLFNLILSTLL